jgi:HSP20 family protein
LSDGAGRRSFASDKRQDCANRISDSGKSFGAVREFSRTQTAHFTPWKKPRSAEAAGENRKVFMKLTKRGQQQGSQGALAPYGDINRIRSEINRIFQDPFAILQPSTSMFEGWEPKLDIFEDKDKVTVNAELPGMKKEDIEVNVQGDTLTIAGERKEEHEEQQEETFRSERFFGRFQRSITLPQVVDPQKVQANYKDGVLTITLPKSEEAKPKQIEVNAS